MSKLDLKATGAEDLGASLSNAFRLALMRLEHMLPAVVVTVDRAAGRCNVKPMVMAGTADGQKVPRPVVANVPIMCLGGGGIYASYPVKAGDKGFIFGADRDTSLYYQGKGGEDWPNTERLHSFSDGAFLPLRLFDFAIAGGVLSDGFAIQTEDGNTFMTLKSGEIQLQASKIKLLGDVEALGGFTSNGKNVSDSHTHSGVESGSSSTGGVN